MESHLGARISLVLLFLIIVVILQVITMKEGSSSKGEGEEQVAVLWTLESQPKATIHSTTSSSHPRPIKNYTKQNNAMHCANYCNTKVVVYFAQLILFYSLGLGASHFS